MPLSRPQTTYSWFPYFGRYLLSPEAIGLYVLSGLTLYGLSKNTSLTDAVKDVAKEAIPAVTEGVEEAAQQNGPAISREMTTILSKLMVAFNRHPQIMVPAVTSIFGTTLTAFYQRYSINTEEENREYLQEIAKLKQDVDLHQKHADDALNRQDYFLAYKQLCAAGTITKQLYQKTINQTDADAYITCVIRQARALYDLKKYEQALTLLETLLHDKLISHSLLYTATLNLSGLIAYKQASLPMYAAKPNEENIYREQAQRYFSQSYRLDPSQNSVYFYIRYLQGGEDNYKYISENIPAPAFEPTIYLSVSPDDGLRLDMSLLFADALFQHKQHVKSVTFYESWLEHIEGRSNAFVELAYLNILCFRAYAQVMRDANGQNVSVSKMQTESSNELPTENTIVLIPKDHTTSELRERAEQLLKQARIYLESELFIDDNLLERAKLHMQHAYTHLALAQAITLQIVMPFTKEECNQKAREQFQEADKLLKQVYTKATRNWTFNIYTPDVTEHDKLSQELAKGMALIPPVGQVNTMDTHCHTI